MSNLLSQASLVMIPSGYKEDVVYSAIPTNGNGDLSFTRASNGTRVNSAGLVEVCPWNLVQYSEDFSTTWNQVAITIGTNATTAPNGTTTAESFTSSATLANHVAYQSLTGVSGAYTFSVYVKKVNSSYVYIKLVGDSAQWVAAVFDLNDGTLTKSEASGWTGLTASSESVGNGWYRLIVSGSGATSVNFNVGIQYTNTGTPTFSAYADASFTGTGTIDYYIWGAQLNIGSTAKPYFPTTDRLNVPRLTYQNGGGGCPSLLLEKQSTNLLSYSEDFSNAVYTKRNSTIGSNVATSPDGTTNADKIQEDTSNNRHDIYTDFTCTNGVTYTQTIFAKQGERRYCFMSFGTAILNAGDSFFDLQDGVVVSSPSGVTSSIENMGNGWYRCRITTTCSSNGTGYFVNGPANTSSNYIYQGVSGYGIYIWGVQIEASSYPTSYIPTTSSSATRVADECSKTGISSLIGQSEGTIYWEGYVTPVNNWNSLASVEVVSVRFINLRLNTTNMIELGANGLSTDFTITSSTPAVLGTYYKIAGAYKSGQNVLYVNGVQIGTTATTFTTPTLSEFRFNVWNVFNEQKSVAQAVLFPTRLTNAELASLTTI